MKKPKMNDVVTIPTGMCVFFWRTPEEIETLRNRSIARPAPLGCLRLTVPLTVVVTRTRNVEWPEGDKKPKGLMEGLSSNPKRGRILFTFSTLK